MKQHTSEFKDLIKELGRQQDVLITYTIDNTEHTLTVEEINGATPSYQGGLLKSVMKQLDLDSNVDIPIGTEINFKYGLKTSEDQEGNSVYEYLDYGNYIVYSSEKQEDNMAYNIVCYDKMLYAMKDYEDMQIVYPITVRNYINTIAQKIGLTFKNANDTFTNYDKKIASELYLTINDETEEKESMGYTYRDVLDDLSEVVASSICIDDNGQLEIRDINNTNDTIDEEYLKDADVMFGKIFGPVNSIVLSRSESDNIYLKDDESVLTNGLTEIKITDNLIMNDNNRNQYIQGIYDKLHNLTYRVCDFTSTGIMYYDYLDKFGVRIGDTTYAVTLFNNEQDITQGLEEHIFVEEAEQSKTDYTKADKTDRKINQTNLIVDKANQQIKSLIRQVGDRSQKETSITQDIDGISSFVEDIENLTETKTGTSTITINNAVENGLVELHIYGNNTVFSHEFPPRANLTPSAKLVPGGGSLLEIEDEDGNKKLYDLRVNSVLRANAEVQDEYVFNNSSAKIIRRVTSGGQTAVTPVEEDLGSYGIGLNKGTNIIRIREYSANMKIVYVKQNDFTDKAVTSIQLRSTIQQTADQISSKVEKDDIGTEIVQNYESVKIAWNNIDDYIKFINGQLQILNNNENKLMALDKTGQHFYEDNGNLIGDMGIINYPVPSEYGDDPTNVPMIAFNLDITQNNDKGMAWGVKRGNNFYPLFYCVGQYAPESGEYGASFYIAGNLEAQELINEEAQIDRLKTDLIQSKNEELPSPVFNIPIGEGSYSGYAMTGINQDFTYQCSYVESGGNYGMAFYKDGEYIDTVSDERLKFDIEEINDKIINIVGQLKLYQFRTKNQSSVISVGIMAQELIELCNENDINAEDYKILGKIIFNLNENKEYYNIDYSQFLILRQKYNENKIKTLEERIIKLEEMINNE